MQTVGSEYPRKLPREFICIVTT